MERVTLDWQFNRFHSYTALEHFSNDTHSLLTLNSQVMTMTTSSALLTTSAIRTSRRSFTAFAFALPYSK